MKLEMVPTEKIRGPELDVRASVDLESLADLAESIKELGLLQPIVVKPLGSGYELITGNRRRLACMQLGLAEIHAIVLDPSDTTDVIGMRLHENLMRKDLTPIEEAAVYAELFERVGDVDKVAAMCHRSREVVDRRLALLGGDAEVRDAVHDGKIATGVAEELNRVEDVGTRRYLLYHAIHGGVTVETARAWRREYKEIKLAEINQSQPPAALGADAVPSENPYICWLCGSEEEQHDMRVRMVHQTCERMARKSAAERIEAATRGQ